MTPLAATLLLGLAGYGLSLALFVPAPRTPGTARTGAYFSVAPLFRVVNAWALWSQVPLWTFRLAAASMALGVRLHPSERHEHSHLPLAHGHVRRHGEHHRHWHDFARDGNEPHTHCHAHAALTHRHLHDPDIHHRHAHPY